MSRQVLVQSEARSAGLRHAKEVCQRIPPLWPLRNFVAVNPFLGLSDRHFLDAARLMERVSGASILMPTSHYEEKYRGGSIRDEDLEAAIRRTNGTAPEEFARHSRELTATHLKLWLHRGSGSPARTAELPTVAEVADSLHRGTWNRLITGEISKHCAAYYDEGQSSWRMPWRTDGLYGAWRESAALDATLPIHGLKGIREFVAGLPRGADEALADLLGELALDQEFLPDYLHRLLLSVFGWSSHVRFRVRQNELQGIPDNSLVQLLVIRLAHEVALLRIHPSSSLGAEWRRRCATAAPEASREDTLCSGLWQLAAEISVQRSLVAGLRGRRTSSGPETRPDVQAVFCIDTRSGPMRQALEACSPSVRTIGFAGFFGMPIELIPFARQHGEARCPVLLSPKHRVRERLTGAAPDQEWRAMEGRLGWRRLRHGWSAFRTSAVSCFSFVESVGLGFAWKLFRDTFLSHLRAEAAPRPCSHHPEVHSCTEDEGGESGTGIPAAEQVELAWGALRHMGLTRDFARIVLLCGHGGEATNNPYASSLDCGACGGHSGEANARVAAALLNLPEVRAGLRERGLVIPEDTVFLAGLHNTTTDQVTLFGTDEVPEGFCDELLRLEEWLERAGGEVRRKRAEKLGIPAAAFPAIRDAEILTRGADWSQVRPEWALAGNAAFIAAPRERTRHLDLKGRVFLHDYHPDGDSGGETLELILTAPMIVASWINLQYYASTVNPDLFGAGNKVLHNVVGILGVCEGNGGDLLPGLPRQSLHDGQRWMHDPLRLSVFVEAPRERIGEVLSRHEEVRKLVDHEWIHLVALEDEGQTPWRYAGDGNWEKF